jgi:hypothetical protein
MGTCHKDLQGGPAAFLPLRKNRHGQQGSPQQSTRGSQHFSSGLGVWFHPFKIFSVLSVNLKIRFIT